MPTQNYTFNGTENNHGSYYGVRRHIYYWPISGMVGRKVTKATITVYLRSTYALTTGYNLYLMNAFSSSWITTSSGNKKWLKYNDNVYYQYERETDSYFINSRKATFDSTPLYDQPVTLNLSGGEGNKKHTITINIPADSQDISLWNGKKIYLAFYKADGNYDTDELIWGVGVKTDIVLTVQQSVTVDYYNGSAWVPCIVKYWNGSAWIECIPKYYNGSAWIECDSG